MRGEVVAGGLIMLMLLSGCVAPTVPRTAVNDEEPIPDGTECNGMVVLCDRTYDDVTFPETHNAFSTHEDGIYYPAANPPDWSISTMERRDPCVHD